MGALDKVLQKQEAAPLARLGASRPLVGRQAVDRVASSLGRPLSLAERRVVEEEGFVDGEYLDTKGIRTGGVGQTGEWLDKGFEAAFQHHVGRARSRVANFDQLPEYLQAELVQAEYRGDLGGSPTALKKLNSGDYEGAAIEFLNHAEYRDKNTSPGIKKRIEAASRAMLRYNSELSS